MTNNLTTITALTVQYPVAPITRYTQIEDQETKTGLIPLATLQAPTKTVGNLVVALPVEPEYQDQRSRWRRVVDYFRLRYSSQADEIRLSLEREKVLAQAETRAEWLTSSLQSIDAHTTSLRQAYEGISAFKESVEQGLARAATLRDQKRNNIDSLLDEAKKVDVDYSSDEYRRELEHNLGSSGTTAVLQRLHREGTTLRRRAVGEYREVEYIDGLMTPYPQVVETCSASLQLLERAMRTYVEQRGALERTLHTYRGLTVGQIEATRALAFLEGVNNVTKSLEKSMVDVNQQFAAAAGRYALMEPPTEVVPSPDAVKGYLDVLERTKGEE